jgi:hypothetical protein
MSDRKKVRFQQPNEEEKEILIQPKLVRSNAWIEHVKETALKNNLTFKQALSKAKETYKKD